MKRMRTPITLLFLALLLPLRAGSMELDVAGTFGNLGFSEDRSQSKTSLGAASYSFGFRAGLTQPLTESLQLDTVVSRDPLTENKISLAFTHQSEIVTMSVGTYLGILESFDTPLKTPAGISASLEARLTGIGYAFVGAGRPLSDPPTGTGEYWQQHTNAGVGFYLPNVIATLEYRRAQKLAATDTGQTRDRRSEYALTTDIYAKNVPYRVFLTFAYRDYEKAFLIDGSATSRHALGSLIFGARVAVDINPRLTVYSELTNGVYTFGREELLGSFAENDYHFQATTGISVTL